MTETLEFIQESQLTCAVLVFAIAFGESFFLSSYLLPGTILTVGLGGLIRTGTLPPWIALLTWAGTWSGDAMSYYVARRLGGLLRRNRKLARILDWGQAAFARKPAVFIFVSRLAPYVKSSAPTLAGLSGFPAIAFLLLNVFAAALDSAVWIGLGYIGTAIAVSANTTHRVASLVGLLVMLLLIFVFIRECLPSSARQYLVCRAKRKRRGFLFRIRCAFLLVPWNACGWIEDLLGFWNRRCIRRIAEQCLSQAQVGDLVVLARAYGPPWGGIWTHVCMVTNPREDGLVIHAFGRVVEESFRSLPRRCRMALLRVQATDGVIERAVAEARKQLGKPFSLVAGKPKSAAPTTFNCAGLIWFAFQRAGCDLAPNVDLLITPQDLADSKMVALVCDYECPDRSSGDKSGNRSAAWPGHVSRLSTRLRAILRTRRAGRVIVRFFSLLK